MIVTMATAIATSITATMFLQLYFSVFLLQSPSIGLSTVFVRVLVLVSVAVGGLVLVLVLVPVLVSGLVRLFLVIVSTSANASVVFRGSIVSV